MPSSRSRRQSLDTCFAHQEQWKDAIVRNVPTNQHAHAHAATGVVIKIQLIGLESSTGTVFARGVISSCSSPPSNPKQHHQQQQQQQTLEIPVQQHGCKLQDVLQVVWNEYHQRQQQTPSLDQTTSSVVDIDDSWQEWIRLGAVWMLQAADRPQNRPIWCRILVPDYDMDNELLLVSTPTITNNTNTATTTTTTTAATTTTATTISTTTTTTTIRIHCRPARFPNDYKMQDCIVHEDETMGLTVVNKPTGVPAHATVGNAIENMISRYQSFRRRRRENNDTNNDTNNDDDDDDDNDNVADYYCTLPQRLDTETSGLLLMATRKEFVKYMGKLLEQKTLHPTTTPCGIQKRYRCLVCLDAGEQVNSSNSSSTGPGLQKDLLMMHDELKRYQSNQVVVTHYLDAHSPSPKRFVKELPLHPASEVEEENENPINAINAKTKTKTSATKWLDCQLQIFSVGPVIELSEEVLCKLWSNHRSNKNKNKNNHVDDDDDDDDTAGYNTSTTKPTWVKRVVELEIQLLTGRTHQIRGQLSALGCPIVGDSLYGGGGIPVDASAARASNQLALQCCYMEFPTPEEQWKRPSPPPLNERELLLRFSLDQAWWSSVTR